VFIRLTISARLKSVTAAVATWDSWARLPAAGRRSVMAEASENAFRTMRNRRIRTGSMAALAIMDILAC
jgi:hypothetical protein